MYSMEEPNLPASPALGEMLEALFPQEGPLFQAAAGHPAAGSSPALQHAAQGHAAAAQARCASSQAALHAGAQASAGSNEVQLRVLQRQLQEQQQLLNQLQQQQQQRQRESGAARPVSGARSRAGSDRNAARRAVRERQREQQSELEQRLQSVSALYQQLQAENATLLRRLKLLESGVVMREQHLTLLVKGKQQQLQQQPSAATTSDGGTCVAMQHDHRTSEGGGSGGAAASSIEQDPPAAQRHDAPMPSSSQADQDPGQTMLLSSSQRPSTCDGRLHPAVPWTSFDEFPDPQSWDAHTRGLVRLLRPKDYQLLWTRFVQEASTLALASEAHGQDTDVHRRLTQLVTTCLSVTDHIIAVNPEAYYRSMYINLLTGAPESPGDQFWRNCMRRIQVEPHQLEFCKTAMEEHTRKMAAVMSERSQLAQDLSQKLVLRSVEATDLSLKLQSNVHQEHVTNSFVIDFLTMQVLTPLRIALLCAASFPLMPDPTAMAEVALELAADAQAAAGKTAQ